MTAPNRPQLVEMADLERSLSSDVAMLDEGLAAWAIEMVSAAALDLTRRTWALPADVPPGAMAVLGMAARRLYTNPDRFTREAEGDYSYALDASVTNAAIFTAAERATLLEYRGARRQSGIGTLGTYRGDAYGARTGYVPDGSEFGFPWYEERL